MVVNRLIRMEVSARKIGLRIRALREEQDISLRRFALMTDLNKSHLSDIERGKCDLRMSTLNKILSGLGTSISAPPAPSARSRSVSPERIARPRHDPSRDALFTSFGRATVFAALLCPSAHHALSLAWAKFCRAIVAMKV